MIIPHSSTVRQEFSVSMTPMIDVVFLLLIFFVCTASFQIAEAILPSPLSSPGKSDLDQPFEREDPVLERIWIAITPRSDGAEIAVNGQRCASLEHLTKLLTALSAVDHTLPVVLDIDGSVPLGAAIDVYDRCRLARFERIQFAARSAR